LTGEATSGPFQLGLQAQALAPDLKGRSLPSWETAASARADLFIPPWMVGQPRRNATSIAPGLVRRWDAERAPA